LLIRGASEDRGCKISVVDARRIRCDAERLGTVAQDRFSARVGNIVDRTEWCQIRRAGFGMIREQEDAVRAMPQGVKIGIVGKDMRRIGPEAAEPRAVDVAVYQQDLLAGIG